VIESFLRSLVKVYGSKPILYILLVDLGTLKHILFTLVLSKLHTYLEKSLIERAIQYFKDRTENFDDDYYPCTKSGLCNLSYAYKWL